MGLIGGLFIGAIAIVWLLISKPLTRKNSDEAKTISEDIPSNIKKIAQQADFDIAVKLINRTFSDAVIPNELATLLTSFVENPSIHNAEQLMLNYSNFIEFFKMSGNPLSATSNFIENYLKSEDTKDEYEDVYTPDAEITAHNINSDITEIAKKAHFKLVKTFLLDWYYGKYIEVKLANLLTSFVTNPTIHNAEQLMLNFPITKPIFDACGGPFIPYRKNIYEYTNYTDYLYGPPPEKIIINGKKYVKPTILKPIEFMFDKKNTPISKDSVFWVCNGFLV